MNINSIYVIIFYPLATSALLFLLGFGLSYFFVPNRWKQYSFWLAPWFAIIFLITTLIFLNIATITVSQSSWVLAIILSALTLITVFLKKNKPQYVLKRDSVVAFFVVISMIFNLISLLKYEKNLTTVSLGNNDAVNYAFSAEIIKNNLISSTSQLKVESVDHMFNEIYRWGPPVLESFFLTIFNLQGYQYTYVIQVVLFALIIPLVYILLQLLYKKLALLSFIFVLIITVFNVNLLYILYHNFFGQVLFWGLQLFIIIYFLFYLSSSKTKRSFFNKDEIVIGLTLAVVAMTYSEGILFIILPWIGYLCLQFIIFRKNITSYLIFSAKALAIAISINIVNIVPIIRRISGLINSSGSEPIGWEPFRSNIPFPNPYEILGFYSIHSFEPLYIYFAVLISLLVVIVIVYGLLKSKFKSFVFSFFIFYIAVYFWTGIYRHNYFEYYKSVTYTLFLLLILFTIGLCKVSKKRKSITIIVAVLLVGLEIFSAVKLNKKMNQYRLSADASLISLASLNQEFKIEENIYSPTLLIDEGSIWPRLWREYFLYPRKLIDTPKSYSIYSNKIPTSSLVLLPKKSEKFNIPKVIHKAVKWENEYYTLGRICNADDCLIKKGNKLSSISFGESNYEDTLLLNGWSTKELGARWISSKEATARLVAGDETIDTFTIEALTLKEPQQMKVYVNDKFIGAKALKSKWETYSFEISPKQNEVVTIKLMFENTYSPAELGLSPDTRDLAAQIKSIKIE